MASLQEFLNCRQGYVIPFTPIRGPDAWYARDYADPESYSYHLTVEDVIELDAAIKSAQASHKAIKVVSFKMRSHQKDTRKVEG